MLSRQLFPYPSAYFLPLFLCGDLLLPPATTGQHAELPCVLSSRSHAERCRVSVRRKSFIAVILSSNSPIFLLNRSRTLRHSSAPPVAKSPLISSSVRPSSCACLMNCTRSTDSVPKTRKPPAV